MNCMARLAFIPLFLLLGACEQALRAPTIHAENQPPERLSEWGIVRADKQRLLLSEGVVPYSLNMPLFSDYALKLRTLWMPGDSAANFREQGVFEFPVGTIISKTFHYEKAADWHERNFTVIRTGLEPVPGAEAGLDLDTHMLLETRLLIRYETGWRALPYVWNAEQSDAFLALAGDEISVHMAGAQSDTHFTYIVPDANQCGGCHVTEHDSKAIRPIGPKAWQLDRPYAWWADETTQLAHWAQTGRLEGLSDPDFARPQRNARSLAENARAYLDANCAHCHNPEGAADTSALHLNLEAPLDRKFGICKTPVAVGRGSGDRPYDIYPGRPEESILVFRMQHADPAIAMPELGRGTVHSEGVSLISNWIASLDGEC